MKDISILAFFGINTDELESYELEDKDPEAISISVTKRKVMLPCPNCGTLTNKVKDYKHKRYFFRNINGYNLNVFFKHRRYECDVCHQSFMESNPFINNRNYKLSSLKIQIILGRLKKGLSIKQTAEDSGVSEATVYKVLDEYCTPPKRKMPRILSIDEFLSFNSDLTSKYSCLLLNFETGNIVDIIRSRQKPWLVDFFSNVPKEQLNSIEYLIIDMYKTYKEIASIYFPQAIVLIDPFHYIRYTTEAIDSVRIRTMTSFLDTEQEYKMLKKYKDLLLMKYEPDNSRHKRIRIMNDIRLTDEEILSTLLNYSNELKEAYELGHAFLKAQERFDYDGFKEFMKATISRYASSSIKEFNEVSETYMNWYKEICNSRLSRVGKRNLSNGPIEGRNNKIKVLKRISYGMTNFEHLRKRIFLIFEDKTTPRKNGD